MIGETGGGSGNYDIVCSALPDGKELFVKVGRGRWVDDEASVFVFVFEDILNIVRSDVAAGCASDDDNFEIPGRIAVISREKLSFGFLKCWFDSGFLRVFCHM